VRFTVLHPGADDYRHAIAKTNNMSCVLRIENAEASVLLTSDIEARDERALLERAPQLLRSRVLVVPHHGSRTSSTADFVAAVGAEEVIFPVGYRNRYRHPHPDVLERHGRSRQWRTDRNGAIGFNLSEASALSAYRSDYRRYWHER
jgi:competence protein ComEC